MPSLCNRNTPALDDKDEIELPASLGGARSNAAPATAASMFPASDEQAAAQFSDTAEALVKNAATGKVSESEYDSIEALHAALSPAAAAAARTQPSIGLWNLLESVDYGAYLAKRTSTRCGLR